MERTSVDSVLLGRTGVRVGRLALGTVNFGARTDEPEANRILDAAVEQGLNLIDTADIYGWRVRRGYTEEMIGRWLATRPGSRDQVVLASKVGNPMGDGLNDQGLSASHIIRACEASLRRLGTDHIDLYQMHVYDPTTSWDVIWQAMDTLITQGKVLYVGSSNFAGWNIVEAHRTARERGMVGLVSEQCAYNLVTRLPELEILPAASSCNLAILAWAPLHGGLLSGALSKATQGRGEKSSQGRAAAALTRHRQAVQQYEDWCTATDRDPAETGLAWLLSRPTPIIPLIGPRTVGHVESAVRAVTQVLSGPDLQTIDSLFPPVGRGGPAPDAWLD